MEAIKLPASEISEYYKNKSVFITGATGFLGKVLIEKLLRSCYDLKKIYVLIRAKKNKSAIERLNELLDCKVSKSIFKVSLKIFLHLNFYLSFLKYLVNIVPNFAIN